MFGLLISIVCLPVVFIAWWFFADHERWATTLVKIRLSRKWSRSHGGYSPGTIVLKNQPRIIFNRKDPSSCLDQVVFPDFGVHEDLPLIEKHVIEITPEKRANMGIHVVWVWCMVTWLWNKGVGMPEKQKAVVENGCKRSVLQQKRAI